MWCGVCAICLRDVCSSVPPCRPYGYDVHAMHMQWACHACATTSAASMSGAMSPEERRRCSAAPPPLVPLPAGEERPVASLEGAISQVSRETSSVEIAISATRSPSTDSTA